MAGDELFGDLPGQAKPQADAAPLGAPRLREPARDQIELRSVDIDSLIGADHRVRVIWDYVEGLDLSELEDRIKAREHRAGHPAAAPRLLLGLWLYATSDGVGSARALARLCITDDVYRWLCGGVSVNYHSLADFRVSCADLLDRLLSEHLAALAKASLVDLETLAQDGVRIRANAGAGSFRREATLDRQLALAQAVVEELKRETDADPGASNQRIRAAKERAARERSARVQAAKAALAEIKRKRQELDDKGGNGKKPKEPRASTTDPQARVMKMADAGFRPAYNVQVLSAAGETIVAAIKVENTGSDRGLLRPMMQDWATRNGRFAQRHLVDGGFVQRRRTSSGRIAKASRSIVRPRNPRAELIPTSRGRGTEKAWWRGEPAWRAKPARRSTRPAPFANASMPAGATGGLRQVSVRGIEKVRAVVLWYALTNNILEGHRLAAA